MVLEAGVGSGILLYIAAVLLGIVLLPNKLAMIPYGFLFGYYGILKFFIEKIHSGILQVLLKAIFFAAVLCVGLLGFESLLLGSIHLPDYPIWILIVGGIIMMLLYDYIYTLLIDFYQRRIRNRGADNMKLS